jgi:hypothetical protein
VVGGAHPESESTVRGKKSGGSSMFRGGGGIRQPEGDDSGSLQRLEGEGMMRIRRGG